MLQTAISEIMSENVVRIKETATVREAAHILLRFQINGLLIVRIDDENKVIGIITTTDLMRLIGRAFAKARHFGTELEKVAQLRVIYVASKTVVGVQKTEPIRRVITLMCRKKVHTIPIYDGKRLVEVVGKHDLINAAFYPQNF